MAGALRVKDEDVVYHLRDRNVKMVRAWSSVFTDYSDTVQISNGDIFRGAPAVDAIVSPANSFGFMEGGIDAAYTRHFGQQMQNRLHEKIVSHFDGEVLVGDAAIIPCYDESVPWDKARDWLKYNEGKPIKYLISAPTMRVPLVVADTINAYHAFRGVILAVRKHNKKSPEDPIASVLIPGLATNVGEMPHLRCACQMLQAYETYALKRHTFRVQPDTLIQVFRDHHKLCKAEKHTH